MPQLENIEAIEKRLWEVADTLRSNSEYASNEYFLPVMGLVFLRHAYSRYLAVKDDVVANLPKRKDGKPRKPNKNDFSRLNAILLAPEAQFDYLVELPDSEDRAKAIIKAMESIESDYENLRGILPKNEYQKLSNEVLGSILRALNPDELKTVSGDVFGRIYEYFLTKFADQKAHDGGEFFTPISIVSLIAHVLDPERGTVLDPACGSGGMFVQSARTVVEKHGQNPTENLTFRGMEKNETTLRLAKMNLTVHGLEGNIQQAITYYEDPHELVGKAEHVMANPPFNVDEIDAGKIETDPRLPFGLPGINKKGKVSNGNYVWISYFYSYLNEQGRAGFVMSSQASSASGGEAAVRQKLVETGDVDLMIAIRSNFFYTRSVPCELWFFNRNKPQAHRDKVLMIDARNVYREVTRKICDFSPEQEKNLLAIVWLYRGETDRFLQLVSDYLQKVLDESMVCFNKKTVNGKTMQLLPDYLNSIVVLTEALLPFLESLPKNKSPTAMLAEYNDAHKAFSKDREQFTSATVKAHRQWEKMSAAKSKPEKLNELTQQFASLAEASRNMIERVELVYKLATGLIELCEKKLNTKKSEAWNKRDIARARKDIDQTRRNIVEQLKLVDYFWRQAHWLTERFPKAELRDVEGLVKLVDHAELEANDWSLTPGRYVGVAPEEEDENFDFKAEMRKIHGELDTLNDEAAKLAKTIQKNFEGLGA